MSAIPRPHLLSEAVAAPLRQVAKRRWRLVAGIGLLQLLVVCLTVWLAAALIAGTVVDLPRVARVSLGVLAWATLLFSVVVFLPPMFRRRTLSGLARQIESELGDSRELLSSAVELSADQDTRFAGSPELVAHVIHQAESAAKAINPESLVSFKPLNRWAMALYIVLFSWAVLIPAMPTPLRRGLYILLTPWKVQLPPGLAAVTVTPGDIALADGDPLEITAVFAPRFRYKLIAPAAELQMRNTSGQNQKIEMTRTGDRAFRWAMDHANIGFSYRVSGEDGVSPWYIAKVMPRPELLAIDVRYNYPAYTKLPSKIDAGKDGAIDALAGTEAQITLHASQTLGEKSRLIVGEKTSDEQSISLTSIGNNNYNAKLIVAKTTSYRLDLINSEGLTGRDDLLRPITARPDQPPVIAITSPAAKIIAPLDDTVPVQFAASDDFGLTKLEAIVQIEGQGAETMNVEISTGETKTSGRFNLVIADQLAKKKLRDANRIEYQLKVTDNRNPDPQVGFSAKQVIEIDHAFKETLAARKEAEAAKELVAAIQKAIAELAEEKSRVKQLVKSADKKILSAAARKDANAVKDAVVKTDTDLKAVAQKNEEGPLADAAEAAKKISDGLIQAAGEELAKAVLESDKIEERQKDLAASAEHVDAAEKALQKLLEQVKVEAKQEEVARALQDMANHEKAIAQELAKPEKQQIDRGQTLRQQEALRQRLEEVLNQNKELNTPSAQAAAQRNQQLIQKIEQLEEQQKRLDGLAEKQQAVKAAQEPLKKLAVQQKALNQEIKEFAKKEQAELKDAGAHPPADQKLDNIVQALEQPNREAEANQQQREAANELKQAAQQLANAAKSNDAPPGQRERQDKQDIDRAKAAAKEAGELKKEIDASKTAKDQNQAKEQIKQKEQQLAQKLEQQTGEMKARDPAQKDALDAVKKEIDQAKQDAQNGDAGKAEQELADAAAKLEAAAHADDAAAQAEQKEMAADAKTAEALAKKQQELADQTAKAAQELAKARQQQGDRQQLERGEQQAAAQAEQVANEAAQVAQQDQQQSEPAMASRATEVQKDLKEAARHEQAAAKAAHDNQPEQAAAEQQAAESALAQAEQAARGMSDQDAAAKNGSAEKGSDAAASKGNKPSAENQMRQAADRAQEARQAEQEAMSGKSNAAAEAARALEQAAAEVSSAAHQPSDSNGPKSGEPKGPSQAKGDPANPSAEPSAKPGSTPGEKGSQPTQATESRGADVTGMARVDERPASVKEIGISASDWVRLPPLVQQQLVSAAQQNGPPGYQERIKKYFVKIAKIQANGEGK